MTDEKLVMLSNRLKKRNKHLRKWARRIQTDCFRVYDRDIPEIPLSIDRYGDAVVVYDWTHDSEQLEAKEWCPVISDALGLDVSDVFWKRRSRQKGLNQYEKLGNSARRYQVIENGYRFWVNLRDYIDTGIFPDHRRMRDLSTEAVSRKSFLNLFAYTGSFSVYAAMRGAARVTTVDMSNTYLDWAKDNFELNGLSPRDYVFVQDDVMQWLAHAREKAPKYDIIICDPPTFSNSKRMENSFEIERDQLALIKGCAQRLNPNGTLWWSTNKRRFKLSDDVTSLFRVEETTHLTRPEDFRQRPHQSWKMTLL